MSQGYLKEMENVASKHLQLSSCWTLLAVPAAGPEHTEKET